MKGVGQRRDALAAGEKMQRQRVGVRLAAEQRELPAIVLICQLRRVG
jgi:hypothetical protein